MNYIIREELEKVYEESVSRNSDLGSSVLGYNLLLHGKKVVPQPFQGSSGCYNVYKDVKEFLIGSGYDESDITINYGSMD